MDASSTRADVPNIAGAGSRSTAKLLALEVARMRDMIANAPDDNRLHLVEKSRA